jgi:AbrB family looped-hinge helix DNA binding protein
MNEVYRAKLNEEGCLVIPAELRKALGLQTGQEVLIRKTENGLELTTFDMAVQPFTPIKFAAHVLNSQHHARTLGAAPRRAKGVI